MQERGYCMNSFTEQEQGLSEYQANLEIFMQVPLFSGLPLDPLKLLAYLSTRESYKADEVIFQQGEVDGNAYFIITGKARLILDENDSKKVIKEYGEGDFIGGLSLFCRTKRLFSLQAAAKTVCLVLTREKLEKTLEQFPGITRKILEEILATVYQWEFRFVTEYGRNCSSCLGALGVSLV